MGCCCTSKGIADYCRFVGCQPCSDVLKVYSQELWASFFIVKKARNVVGPGFGAITCTPWQRLAQYRFRTGFGRLRKVMEIENAIFQDLESFGKEKFFKVAMEKFWICARDNSKISRNVLETLYEMFVHFTICNKRHNPQKNHKM